MMMRVKNHHALPMIRPANDLQSAINQPLNQSIKTNEYRLSVSVVLNHDVVRRQYSNVRANSRPTTTTTTTTYINNKM